MRNVILSLIWFALFLVAGIMPGHAQASRTWVSGVGDDANPCSRTAPCKTFAGAISKTAAGGEISVLDPGGFGAVTITKSISIVADGSEGSILTGGTNGININAGVNDVVSLSGIYLEGLGTSIYGVNIASAKAVNIRKCLIRDYKGVNGTGIFVAPSAAAIKVAVSECTLSDNRRGVVANPTSNGSAVVLLDRVVVENNITFGIRAAGNSTIYMNNTVVTGQTDGLSSVAPGSIVSFGNNAIINNTTDGAPNSIIPLK